MDGWIWKNEKNAMDGWKRNDHQKTLPFFRPKERQTRKKEEQTTTAVKVTSSRNSFSLLKDQEN